MKLRLAILFSLILHVSIFLGLHDAVWTVFFPAEIHDLTTFEILEVMPSQSTARKSKPVPVRKLANPMANVRTDEKAKEAVSDDKPREDVSNDSNISGKQIDAVSVGAVTVAPKVLQEKRIAYPERARRAGVEGIVELKLVIDRDGKVHEAEVSQGLGFGLDEAALEAIKQFSFSPAKMGANAVAVRIIYKYRFQLNR